MDVQKRFCIMTEGDDDNAYKEAMSFACKLADKNNEINKIILLVSTKDSARCFKRLFGSEIVKLLFNGYVFENCKHEFKIETLRTYNSHNLHNIVITCGIDSNDIFKIDDVYYRPDAIISIAWTFEGLEKWNKTWNSKEIRGKQKLIKPYKNPSCIVQEALKELNNIRKSTSIHPSDEEKVKTYILALHKHEKLDADIIGAYLIRELNWYLKHVNYIEQLINTLNNGKHFKGGDLTKIQSHYERWNKACKL